MFSRIFSWTNVIPVVTIKRSLNTIIWKETLINCSRTVQKNLKLSIIHGPTADEVELFRGMHLYKAFVSGGFKYRIPILEELGFHIRNRLRIKQVAKDINLENKTCLITGANSGIGLEVTRCLSSRGCEVLMACRNKYAASVVAKNVCEKHHLLDFYEVNLASLASVKNCCDNIIKDHKKIDFLILNAATFGLPWSLTEDGLETTFQVNYLSQQYLLKNIEKILAPNARVVFTSSESHRNIDWPLQKVLAPTLQDISLSREEYTSIRAYNISKLCGILAMHYLGYRWLGTDKMVFCANPGTFVKTKLCRNWWVYEYLYNFMRPFTKSIPQAASTVVYSTVSPDLQGLSALYFNSCTRCEESDLAKDSYLSFKIQDLTRDILRERTPDSEDSIDISGSISEQNKFHPQDNYEPALVSNYSG